MKTLPPGGRVVARLLSLRNPCALVRTVDRRVGLRDDNVVRSTCVACKSQNITTLTPEVKRTEALRGDEGALNEADADCAGRERRRDSRIGGDDLHLSTSVNI